MEMSLIDFFERNGIPIPSSKQTGGFLIRKPPKEQGDLSPEEWRVLRFDPDEISIELIGDVEAQARDRSERIALLQTLLSLAAKARKQRLEKPIRDTATLDDYW
jgi:hypothetical protein